MSLCIVYVQLHEERSTMSCMILPKLRTITLLMHKIINAFFYGSACLLVSGYNYEYGLDCKYVFIIVVIALETVFLY